MLGACWPCYPEVRGSKLTSIRKVAYLSFKFLCTLCSPNWSSNSNLLLHCLTIILSILKALFEIISGNISFFMKFVLETTQIPIIVFIKKFKSTFSFGNSFLFVGHWITVCFVHLSLEKFRVSGIVEKFFFCHFAIVVCNTGYLEYTQSFRVRPWLTGFGGQDINQCSLKTVEL